MLNIFRYALFGVALLLTGCFDSDKGPSDRDLDGAIDSVDCAPDDAGKWAYQDYKSIDEDVDGKFIRANGQVCTGALLPTNYLESEIPLNESDCDDQNPNAFRKMVIYKDDDGDGVGSGQGSITCMGLINNIDSTESIYGFDPEPNNPDVSDFDVSPAILAAP